MPLAIFILASAIVLAAIILSVTKHKETEAMSAAFDHLTASINNQSAKIDGVTTAMNVAKAAAPDDAAVAALADTIDANNARLDALSATGDAAPTA